MHQSIFPALLFVAVSNIAFAEVTVKDPWVRATVAQQKSTGAFMQLSSSTATRLVEARSSAAAAVEIHEMAMAGDVMKMRPVAAVELPAGQTVDLKSGAYHIMLVNLKAQIKSGDSVPITLVFEGKDKKRETVEVKATARALNDKGGGMEMMHH